MSVIINDVKPYQKTTPTGSNVGQANAENNYQSPTEKTLAIPTDIKSTPAGISPTTIEIDRNTFMELISNRIGNNTEAIRDSIKDSIMSVYTGIR